MENSGKIIICDSEGPENILMKGQKIFRIVINKARVGEKRSPHFTAINEVADWVLKCNWLEKAERVDIVERAKKHFG